MKVKNITNNNGNKVANQFIITDGNKETFQSYKSIICERDYDKQTIKFSEHWNYSRTTSKYLNQFLGLSTNEIKDMIKNNEITIDLAI